MPRISRAVICAGLALGLLSSTAAADRRASVVLESPCPGPACTAALQPQHAQGHRVVFLNFDGVTLTRSFTNDDARINVSAIVNSPTEVVPPFDPADLVSTGGLSRAQIIAQVVEDLYVIHEPYDVEFVTVRPASGDYSMVVFGGNCDEVASRNCAGVAIRDCGDQMPANVTFVFARGLRVRDLATTAAQEAAHAWGLGHTDDREDIMYPVIQQQSPRSYGAGNITGANGSPDGSGCPSTATYQDSHGRLLQNIGPRGQDATSPVVTFAEPADGETIFAGSLIRVEATDNVAVDRVELLLDGKVIRELESGPWEFALSASTPHGEHSLTVRATDLSGNTGQTQIHVFVNIDNAVPCADDTACDTGHHCNGTVCVPDEEPGPDFAPDMFQPCVNGGDCSTGVCVTVGENSLCSQTCSEDSACPTGTACLDDTACWPEVPAVAMCTANGAGGGGVAALVIFLAIAAVMRRRDR